MTNVGAKIREQMNYLSREERLQLLLELWSTLSEDDEVAMTDDDRKLLDERLSEHEANPDDTIPADQVLAVRHPARDNPDLGAGN